MARPETFAFTDRAPFSLEESWARLLRHVGHWSLLGFGLFAVEERSSGEVVGEVGLADFRRGLGADFDGLLEAAWTIHPAWWGRGYAHEAALAAHQWLEGQRLHNSTICMIHKDNQRSIRVAAKLDYASLAHRSHRGSPVIIFRRWNQP